MLYTYFLIKSATQEKGAAMAEYGLLLALIAVICIAALTLLGEGVRDTFTAVVGSL